MINNVNVYTHRCPTSCWCLLRMLCSGRPPCCIFGATYVRRPIHSRTSYPHETWRFLYSYQSYEAAPSNYLYHPLKLIFYITQKIDVAFPVLTFLLNCLNIIFFLLSCISYISLAANVLLGYFPLYCIHENLPSMKSFYNFHYR